MHLYGPQGAGTGTGGAASGSMARTRVEGSVLLRSAGSEDGTPAWRAGGTERCTVAGGLRVAAGCGLVLCVLALGAAEGLASGAYDGWTWPGPEGTAVGPLSARPLWVGGLLTALGLAALTKPLGPLGGV